MLVNQIPDFGGKGCAYISAYANTRVSTHMLRDLILRLKALKFTHSTQANSYFYRTISLCRLSVPPSLGPYLVGNRRVSGLFSSFPQ